MATKQEFNMLEVKTLPHADSAVIGQRPTGGVLMLDGNLVWLRHPSHRYNGQNWGWEGDGFTYDDTSRIGYHLYPPQTEVTLRSSQAWLELLRRGELPKDFTIGIEIEGTLYDKSGGLLSKHDGHLVKVEEDQHPELVHFTVETATSQNNGSHLRTPVETTIALSESIFEAKKIADLRQGTIVHSSVPEGGQFKSGTITQHPYLLSFAPKVLRSTLDHWDLIPPETKVLYQLLGVDIQQHLEETGNLNWPVNALHVHTGIPQIDGLGDTRAAYACGVLRLTEFAKIVSFMLFNTRHVYGVDTGLADVRSIMRRLLASTLDSRLPTNAQHLMERTIKAMENGEVHSPSRYPASGQHDRVRFRSEAQYITVESIDPPMNPDLRLVLMWTFFNQIMNVIALDELENTKGDESQVIAYLRYRWGDLFTIIPATGQNSSFEQDLLFNKEGYDGKVPWLSDQTFRDLLFKIRGIVDYYSAKYPAISTQARTVTHMISQHAIFEEQRIALPFYFGIESGQYAPNCLNRGIVTSSKAGLSLNEILAIQAQGTYLQAEALRKTRDDQDLLAFFGRY